MQVQPGSSPITRDIKSPDELTPGARIAFLPNAHAPTQIQQGLEQLAALIASIKGGEGTQQVASAAASGQVASGVTTSQAAPIGLEQYQYGSLSAEEATLLGAPNEEYAKKEYIKAYVPTAEVAGQLKEGGVANVFNPEWQQQVADAVERNGGLGNAEDGYLAWTKMGFVRYKNENLTDEQNRRMAEITLQTGFHMEDTPGRSEESVTKENVDNWVNTFIERHDKELADFMANPEDGYSVQDGSKRHFKLEFNQDAGRVVSYNFRKSGGLRGWVQKNMKYIGPVLDVVSVVGHAIPGVGTAVALGAAALKTASSWIATGKLKASQAISAVAGFIPGGSTIGTIASKAAGFAANVIETGKVTAKSVVDLVSGFFGTTIPSGIKQLGSYAAHAIDTGKLKAKDLIGYALSYLSESGTLSTKKEGVEEAAK